MKRFIASLLALITMPLTACAQGAKSIATEVVYSQGSRGPVAHAVASRSQDVALDVNDFGASNDKKTDNCAAFTNGLASAGSTWRSLLIPASGGEYMTSCTLVLPQGVSLIVDGILGALPGGTASTALVATDEGPKYNWILQSLEGHGALDGNNVSANVVWLKQYSHVAVHDVQIYGIPKNGNGLRLGDSTANTSGFEAELQNVSFGDAGITPAAPASTCLFIDTSTDTQYTHGVLNGCAIGINDTQGNSHYTDLHAWDKNMTTCYLDAKSRTVWVADQCDTPNTYGWHLKGTNTQIIGGSFVNNIFYGTDKHVVAIQSDLSDPQWTIEGFLFQGGNATHRIAADTNVRPASLSDSDIWLGAVYVNTVTENMGRGLLSARMALPKLHSKSGLRYLCIDKNGVVIASSTPCHGT